MRRSALCCAEVRHQVRGRLASFQSRREGQHAVDGQTGTRDERRIYVNLVAAVLQHMGHACE